MRVRVSQGPLSETRADALVVGRHSDEARLAREAAPVDRALGGLLLRALREERFEARVGQIAHVHGAGRLPATRVVVVGMGPRAECTEETVRRAASAGARRARDLGARSVAVPLLGTRLPAAARAQAIVEGARLGLYSFDR